MPFHFTVYKVSINKTTEIILHKEQYNINTILRIYATVIHLLPMFNSPGAWDNRWVLKAMHLGGNGDCNYWFDNLRLILKCLQK